jgi:preprotein translocase subunit SecA
LLDRVNYEVISILSKFEVKAEEDVEKIEEQRREALKVKMAYEHAGVDVLQEPAIMPAGNTYDQSGSGNDNVLPFVRDERKVGRNETCPCGSGKKYKQCHGALSQQ